MVEGGRIADERRIDVQGRQAVIHGFPPEERSGGLDYTKGQCKNNLVYWPGGRSVLG